MNDFEFDIALDNAIEEMFAREQYANDAADADAWAYGEA